MQTMNIGEAAQATGVSAKMIRHYESVGLYPPPHRTEAGYRQYSRSDVHTLRFIRHARDLGFSIVQIGELVSLWHDHARPSRQVRAIAQAHILELERKAQDLLAMKATLEHLVHRCRGDGRPNCPIIDSLADETESPAGTYARRRTTKPAALAATITGITPTLNRKRAIAAAMPIANDTGSKGPSNPLGQRT